MPRDIPVGNGQLLVAFDEHYQIRDLYFPFVGQENHVNGAACRFGVWSSIPVTPTNRHDRRRRRLFWTTQGWQISLNYQPDTLASDVRLLHDELQLQLHTTDVVDFHRSVLVRRIELVNLHHEDRDVRLFHHNNFSMYGTKVGDTVYFDPQLRSLIHYQGQRYLMTTWHDQGEQRIDEYASGFAGFLNAEGTWRDAEDGQLGGNSIAQGAVDSTMMVQVHLPASGRKVVYLILGAGQTKQEMTELHRFIQREGPQGIIDRTMAYWRLWLAAARVEFPEPAPGSLPESVIELFRKSLLILRTQIDNHGAIIAANDTDIMQFSRDTYSYLWPRDGALVAAAIDEAGFPDVARSFFSLCARIIDKQGYFLHKYNPDGSPASSWHPWISLGKPQLPIQQDETALVIWALWRHYALYRDIEFVRHLWVQLIVPAADFLVRFRDPKTKLPLPSYDLWEERWGVHAFTVSSVYAGLQAAWRFATCFGDQQRSDAYARAADEVRQAFQEYFWSTDNNSYHRRIVPLDHARTARLMAEVMGGRTPTNLSIDGTADGLPLEFEYDSTPDSSMVGLFMLGMLDVNDPKVDRTMQRVSRSLWVKTGHGGMARYQGDDYQRLTDSRDPNVPGNPWFVCTLWLADWHIAKARTIDQLSLALPIYDWVARHALPSGVLAEQVHPHDGRSLSVSPLTWSHAALVSSVTGYLRKLQSMSSCPHCGQPSQRLVQLSPWDQQQLSPPPPPLTP